MKKISGLLLITLIVFGSCKQQEHNQIEGVWELTEANWVDAHIEGRFPGDVSGNQIKMWSGNHFFYAGHFTADTLINDNLGGGTFTLNANRYIENVEYQCSGENIGREFRLILEVANDTLVQKWPVNENWELPEKYNMEKYIRID